MKFEMKLTLYVTLFISIIKLSFSDIQCYKCLWTRNISAYPYCQQSQFDDKYAAVEQCKHGCLTSATYIDGVMTTFARACALRDVKNDYTCGKKTEGSSEEISCFCTKDFCNGESKSEKLDLPTTTKGTVQTITDYKQQSTTNYRIKLSTTKYRMQSTTEYNQQSSTNDITRPSTEYTQQSSTNDVIQPTTDYWMHITMSDKQKTTIDRKFKKLTSTSIVPEFTSNLSDHLCTSLIVYLIIITQFLFVTILNFV